MFVSKARPLWVHICCLMVTDVAGPSVFTLAGCSTGAMGSALSHWLAVLPTPRLPNLSLPLFPGGSRRGIMMIIVVNLFHRVVLKLNQLTYRWVRPLE